MDLFSLSREVSECFDTLAGRPPSTIRKLLGHPS
jgi:hypothetical protein